MQADVYAMQVTVKDTRTAVEIDARDNTVMQVGKKEKSYIERKSAIARFRNGHWMQPIRTTRGAITSDRNHSWNCKISTHVV